ncbi:MAG: dockerin type I repeat-containing protein, partial [Muribaculaceae bacterium]|nr:dockerin type I repeat-containing protein [Muribaculaceae bacterium]
NRGFEMTTTNGEKYTATIGFVDPYGGYSYFSFSTALASSATAWNEIAGKRLGATSSDFLINESRLGTNLTVVAGENAFKVPTNKYNLTLYLSQGILVVEKWTPPAPVVRGDVNNDGIINVADVTALIKYVLTMDPTGIVLPNCNCDNNDSVVNVADVTALIYFILNGVWL